MKKINPIVASRHQYQFRVEAVFQIAGRGVALATSQDLSALMPGIAYQVEFDGTDGLPIVGRATLEMFAFLQRPETKFAIVIAGLTADKITVGSTITISLNSTI